MIRRLRQRHRHVVIALGICLPGLFAVGIAARKPAPMVNELPAALAAARQPSENFEWQRADLFMKSPVQVRLLREPSNSGAFAISFSAAKDFVKPDLLVYWVAGSPEIADSLPEGARLIGAFDPASALVLPPEAAVQTGRLILYSLADNEIVNVSKAIQFNDSPP
jgi:hypothetical protein